MLAFEQWLILSIFWNLQFFLNLSNWTFYDFLYFLCCCVTYMRVSDELHAIECSSILSILIRDVSGRALEPFILSDITHVLDWNCDVNVVASEGQQIPSYYLPLTSGGKWSFTGLEFEKEMSSDQSSINSFVINQAFGIALSCKGVENMDRAEKVSVFTAFNYGTWLRLDR